MSIPKDLVSIVQDFLSNDFERACVCHFFLGMNGISEKFKRYIIIMNVMEYFNLRMATIKLKDAIYLKIPELTERLIIHENIFVAIEDLLKENKVDEKVVLFIFTIFRKIRLHC